MVKINGLHRPARRWRIPWSAALWIGHPVEAATEEARWETSNP